MFISNHLQLGATGFEPATSASRTLRSSQAELRPVIGLLAVEISHLRVCDSRNSFRCEYPGGRSAFRATCQAVQGKVAPSNAVVKRFNRNGRRRAGISPQGCGLEARTADNKPMYRFRWTVIGESLITPEHSGNSSCVGSAYRRLAATVG